MTLALVTGATGHIGSNLVRELLARGYSVRALVRVRSDLSGIDGLDVRKVHGDVLDPASLDAAMLDVDVVFHCAAVYVNWAPNDDEILRPAIEGTDNVLRAAARHGVRRVVMTSSCNAVGFSTAADQPRDEASWNDELHLPYVQAKVGQEKRAWQLAEQLGIELVTVLPTGVLGPHDHRITPTMAYARDAMAGKGPVLPGTANVIDVRDVAIGHVLAAERGRPGERYLLAGDNVSAETLQSTLEAITGRRPSLLGAPRWLLLAVAAAAEFFAGLRGVEPPLTRAMIRTAHGRHLVFDNNKAREELGFRPRPVQAVLEATHDWLVAIGQLEASHNAERAAA